MKKNFLFAIIIFTLSSNLQSQFGWQELSSGVSVSLNDAVLDPSQGWNYLGVLWICGDSGTVLRYRWFTYRVNCTNHGIPTNLNLISIAAKDSLLAVTAGNSASGAFAYRTTNGGQNWTSVFSQPNGYINSVWYTQQADTFFMSGNPVGGRWSLWRSVNGGVTWDSTGIFVPQVNSEHGFPRSMFLYKNLIWIGTNNYRIYFTSNWGATWNIQSTGSEMNIYSISFNSRDYIYNIGFSGGANMLYTTNFGSNWSAIATPGNGNISGICTGVYQYFVKTDNNIYGANYGSFGWNLVYSAPSGNYNTLKIGAGFWNNNYVAIRDNGGISWKDLVISVEQLGSEIPGAYSLSQNYPNPFNPSTVIEFTVPMKSNTRLEIFDELGRSVYVSVNSTLEPGRYKVDWNASEFPSGIYFYKITSGNYTNTRKMVLLK